MQVSYLRVRSLRLRTHSQVGQIFWDGRGKRPRLEMGPAECNRVVESFHLKTGTKATGDNDAFRGTFEEVYPSFRNRV